VVNRMFNVFCGCERAVRLSQRYTEALEYDFRVQRRWLTSSQVVRDVLNVVTVFRCVVSDGRMSCRSSSTCSSDNW